MMRFAVIGAGGLGGYFGALLAEAGHDVMFLARGATLEALRRDGVRIVGALDLHVPAVRAEADAAAIGPVDAVLLTVKTNHLDGVLAGLPALVGPDTAILTMQNGVGTPDVVEAAVGPGHVLPCVVRIFTKVAAPGVIEHMGGPGSVSFGELDGAASPRVAALREAFAGAGVPVLQPEDVRVELWEKAIYVAPLGALGAVADAPLGVVRTRLRDELAAVVAEEVAVARARGVALPADAVERMLAFTDGMPAESTTSMQRDLADGRPNELDGQIGVIVRLGRELGVPTPRHDLLYAVLAHRSAARAQA
jgi:2-dehydropantoate 2-reductase